MCTWNFCISNSVMCQLLKPVSKIKIVGKMSKLWFKSLLKYCFSNSDSSCRLSSYLPSLHVFICSITEAVETGGICSVFFTGLDTVQVRLRGCGVCAQNLCPNCSLLLAFKWGIIHQHLHSWLWLQTLYQDLMEGWGPTGCICGCISIHILEAQTAAKECCISITSG